jgi:hypothetical protein
MVSAIDAATSYLALIADVHEEDGEEVWRLIERLEQVRDCLWTSARET